MNASFTFRQIQCKIVTAASSGTRFDKNGKKMKTMWWTGMHGTLAQLGLESFPSKIEITDTDKDNLVYSYYYSSDDGVNAKYWSEQQPSLPIYLKVA